MGLLLILFMVMVLVLVEYQDMVDPELAEIVRCDQKEDWRSKSTPAVNILPEDSTRPLSILKVMNL